MIDPTYDHDVKEGDAPTPGGDEEQQHRDKIAESGEPGRDKLGNADGAS